MVLHQNIMTNYDAEYQYQLSENQLLINEIEL